MTKMKRQKKFTCIILHLVLEKHYSRGEMVVQQVLYRSGLGM